jgi:hypothetical protein
MTFFVFLVFNFLGAVAGTVYGCSFLNRFNAGQITNNPLLKILAEKNSLVLFFLHRCESYLLGPYGAISCQASKSALYWF